jgi:hypothetical protein
VFKIEDVYCDDKKVGDVLRALLGLVVGIPKAIPVINAKAERGKIKALTNGKLIDMFAHYITSQKADTIKPAEVKAWLKKMGRSPLSYGYLQKQAVKSGLLKKTGATSNSLYYVIRALPKPKGR